MAIVQRFGGKPLWIHKYDYSQYFDCNYIRIEQIPQYS